MAAKLGAGALWGGGSVTYIQVLCLGPWLRYQCEDGRWRGDRNMRGELQVQLSRVVSQEMCVDRRERLKGPGPNSMLHLERKLSPSPHYNPVWLSGWQPVGISPVQPQAQCSPVSPHGWEGRQGPNLSA